MTDLIAADRVRVSRAFGRTPYFPLTGLGTNPDTLDGVVARVEALADTLTAVAARAQERDDELARYRRWAATLSEIVTTNVDVTTLRPLDKPDDDEQR